MPDHVVDHFGEQHGFDHPGPAEQSRLAAAFQRHEHINDLDAGLEISDLVDRRSSGGGARCTERHWTAVGAGCRSMALPNASNIRERMAWPPVSVTAMPRASPCVGVKAIPRTCRASAAPTLR